MTALHNTTRHGGSAVNDWAVDLTNVEKVYGGMFFRKNKGVHALRGIDMRVPRGSIFGLLGPNGAGKSTLVKILMTVIRPTRCEGTMLGRRVGDKGALRSVGYLPEHHRFPDYLTARQVVDHFGAMADVPRADRKKRTGPLLETVGLDKWADKKVKGFSKGMRQRLGIAQSLINEPELVVLDEPTDGVDPVGRRDIRNILLDLKSQGKTVFLNSHLLGELEMVCDYVAILVQGRVSSQGTIDELTAYSRRYEIEVEEPTPEYGADRAVTRVPPLVSTLSPMAMLEARAPGVEQAPTGGGTPPVAVYEGLARVGGEGGREVMMMVRGNVVQVATESAAAVQPLVDALRARGVVIKSMKPVRASLEDLFMRAVTDPETGKELAPGADLSRANGSGGEGRGA